MEERGDEMRGVKCRIVEERGEKRVREREQVRGAKRKRKRVQVTRERREKRKRREQVRRDSSEREQ